MKKLSFLLFIAMTIASGTVFAQAEQTNLKDFINSNIFLMDEKFTHHVIVVEKSSHLTYIFENNSGTPKLIKKYKSATGKLTGNKFIQGDRKTPEGIYTLRKFHSSADLLKKYGDYAKIYGAGAFTTDYPNIIDRRAGKTGGGIWIHSTDDNARVSKGLDSRGCVVVVDKDLKDISQYIDLQNTPIIIVQDLNYLNKETWSINKAKLIEFINSWANSWKNKDFKGYIESYSKSEFNSNKGNFNAYKRYKRAVFARKEVPQINFSNISILSAGEYVVVQMKQDYSSEVIQDIGRKTLYIKKDADYNWKIVAELWSKLDESYEGLAFTPSMRFFQDNE